MFYVLRVRPLDERGQYHSKEHGETIAAHLQNQFWQYSPILEENCIGYTCLHFTPIFIFIFIIFFAWSALWHHNYFHITRIHPSNGFFLLSSFGKENNPKWTHRITLAYTPTSTKGYLCNGKNVLTKLCYGCGLYHIYTHFL